MENENVTVVRKNSVLKAQFIRDTIVGYTVFEDQNKIVLKEKPSNSTKVIF